MKIVYAFIADFPPFKNAEMNFVSDWRCEFNGERLKVCYSEVLPKGFFSPDEQLCVSAVVGPNGAGKTSLVRFFWSLMYPSKKQDFILVVEAKGDLLVHYNLGDRELSVECSGCKVKTVKRYARNDDFQLEELTKCFNVVYYSPHYSLSLPFHSSVDRFVNLSTTYLLNEAVDGSFSQMRPESTSVFRAEEFYRLVRFYEASKDKALDGIGHEIKGIEFLPNFLTLSYLRSEYNEKLHKEGNIIARIHQGDARAKRSLSDNEVSRIRNMVAFLGLDFNDVFMSMFQCLVAILWPYKAYKDRLFKKKMYIHSLYNLCLQLMKNSDKTDHEIVRKKILKFLKSKTPERIEVLRYKDESGKTMKLENPILDFFKLLCGLDSQENANGECFLQMPWNDMLGKLKYVKELYQHVTALGPFVELRFDPPMSSGQYTLHSFYARLYEHFFDIRKSVAGYDGSDFSREWAGHLESGWVVIMDEVEVTLHPEWQRTIISNLLTVFRNHFPGFNVHFVFMTHSPMILSDVPKGNVVLLNEKHCVVDVRRQKAFAANIFELYKDSFLLDKGQIGEFAASKVGDLLGKLKSKRKDDISNEDLKLASLIDDPFISRHVWSRLGQMVMDNDMPEDEINEE